MQIETAQLCKYPLAKLQLAIWIHKTHISSSLLGFKLCALSFLKYFNILLKSGIENTRYLRIYSRIFYRAVDTNTAADC